MRRLPRLIDRVRLAGTRVKVSPVCIGLVQSDRTIAAAFEAGVNGFFLTADMHWPLYEATRRGLRKLFASRKGIRDEIVVVAASYPTQPEFCTRPFAELIESVPGLGRIDVAVMGGAYAADFAARRAVYLEHRRQRRFGIRAIGATFHERTLAPLAIADRLVDLAFARFNPAHPGARDDVFPALPASRRVPLYTFNSTVGYVGRKRRAELGVGRGFWQPAVTDCYRFALSRPEIQGILCAPQTPRELEALARSLEQDPLSIDEEQFLVDVARLDAGTAALVTDRSASRC